MLAEMLISISETLLARGTRPCRAVPETAREAVEALVEWHIEFALAHRALIVVQDRDWSSLPDDARERVRSLQRAYVDAWAIQLRRLDRTMSPETARAAAHVVFGLHQLHARTAACSPTTQMHDLLRTMALGALSLR